MKSGWSTAGPSSMWKRIGTRTPSRKYPVAAGAVPLTTEYATPDTMLETPGMSITARSGSPMVPGTSAQLLPAQRDVRNLGPLALAHNHRLVRVDAQRLEAVDDVEDLSRLELLQ